MDGGGEVDWPGGLIPLGSGVGEGDCWLSKGEGGDALY